MSHRDTKPAQPAGLFFRASGRADLANSSGRIISYIFSDPSVARDGHTIKDWTLDNFLSNPVFLWAHDDCQPPIGKVIDIGQTNGLLRGAVEYLEADISPFADTIYRMVKEGYLNATSVRWDPIRWKLSADKARPGGIDFELADLMEISQVPVPGNVAALATARSAGIDTGPIFDWATRLLDTQGQAIIPRQDLELLRKEAKMPAAKRTAKTVQEGTAQVVDKATANLQRSLGQVGYMAQVLGSLANLEEDIEWEKEYFETDSVIPDQLTDVIKMLGEILKAFVGEEVARLVTEEDGERAASNPVAEALVRSVKARSGPATVKQLIVDLSTVNADKLAEKVRASVLANLGLSEADLQRAGKSISTANAEKMRAACERIMEGHDMISGLLNGDDDETSEGGEDPATETDDDTARRARAAKALALKIGLKA